MPVSRLLLASARASAIAIALSLALSACGAESPPVTAPSQTPIVESPTPTPTPTQSAAPATCETIVTPDSYTELTTGGLSITPQDEFVAKMQDEGQVLAVFGENGGAICQVGGAVSAVEIYGFAHFDETQLGELNTHLAQNGFAEVAPADVDGLLYEVVSDSSDIDRFYLLTPSGDVLVGGTRERINEIAGLAPLS